MAEAAEAFEELALLTVEWETDAERVVGETWVRIDFNGLAGSDGRKTFCVRIGAVSDETLSREGFRARLERVVDTLGRECSEAGIADWELQLDYDCPSRRLGSYAAFLKAFRAGYSGREC